MWVYSDLLEGRVGRGVFEHLGRCYYQGAKIWAEVEYILE